MANEVDISAFIKSLGEYSARQKAACARAVKVFAQAVIGRAMELCPQSPTNKKMPGAGPPHGKEIIDNPRFTGHSGTLRNSATVEELVITEISISCILGFNTEYAAAVHEILTARHTVGEAKYLEKALRELAPKFTAFIAGEMNKEFA